MAAYLVTAPLALIKDETGAPVYRYQGAVVELDGRAEGTKRLVDLDLIAKLDLTDFVVGLGEHVVDEELSGGGDPGDELPVVDLSQLKGEQPPKAASKEAWVDYAELNGIARSEAEALHKADLIGLFTAPE